MTGRFAENTRGHLLSGKASGIIQMRMKTMLYSNGAGMMVITIMMKQKRKILTLESSVAMKGTRNGNSMKQVLSESPSTASNLR